MASSLFVQNGILIHVGIYAGNNRPISRIVAVYHGVRIQKFAQIFVGGVYNGFGTDNCQFYFEMK
jgi:hypothetical protein